MPSWMAAAALCVLAQGCAAPGGNSAQGPQDAPVAAVGTPAGPALSADQRAELDRAVRSATPAERAHLRYAIAKDAAGKDRLAVYDPESFAPATHGAGKKKKKATVAYVVYGLLNASDGSHYDPQQHAILDPIPIPNERELDAANAPRT
ncbi:MAG: hypothetical protein WCE44_15115 [Candidatus Velthaea sp.]